MATTGDVWIIPYFRIWGYVLHVEHFMCYHELWQTSVNDPFSFLNSSLGLAGGKHHQEITIPVLELFFKIWLFQVTFLMLFSIAIFSPYSICHLSTTVVLLSLDQMVPLSLDCLPKWYFCHLTIYKMVLLSPGYPWKWSFCLLSTIIVPFVTFLTKVVLLLPGYPPKWYFCHLPTIGSFLSPDYPPKRSVFRLTVYHSGLFVTYLQNGPFVAWLSTKVVLLSPDSPKCSFCRLTINHSGPFVSSLSSKMVLLSPIYQSGPCFTWPSTEVVLLSLDYPPK